MAFRRGSAPGQQRLHTRHFLAAVTRATLSRQQASTGGWARSYQPSPIVKVEGSNGPSNFVLFCFCLGGSRDIANRVKQYN